MSKTDIIRTSDDPRTMADADHENVAAVSDDGFDEIAAEATARPIRGELLTFADWKWRSGKEKTVMADGRKLVAVAAAALWQKWVNGHPTIVRAEPGKRLPDRDEIGDNNPDQWELASDGKPRDPWQDTRLLYLVDPETAQDFTFSTSTYVGRAAVVALADQIKRMRFAHPGAQPLVALHSAEHKTQHGRKSRPVFRVVGWFGADGEKLAAKQIAAQRRDEMADEIPF